MREKLVRQKLGDPRNRHQVAAISVVSSHFLDPKLRRGWLQLLVQCGYMNRQLGIIEVQGTAEEGSFSHRQAGIRQIDLAERHSGVVEHNVKPCPSI